jgi:hypothetical protein
MGKYRSRRASLALVALMAGAAGCRPIPAEDGVPTGIYFRDQVVESVVPGDLPVVAARTRAVLAELGVTVESREAEERDIDLEIRGAGPYGQAVRVRLREDADENTRVRASVRKSAVEWDREYARIIVERIVQRSQERADRSVPVAVRGPRLPAGAQRPGHPSTPRPFTANRRTGRNGSPHRHGVPSPTRGASAVRGWVWSDFRLPMLSF